MHKLLHAHSPFRIFAFSAITSVAILLAVMLGMGMGALLTAVILAVVELTFSFDNAIINAKVLGKISRPWQLVFLSAGIIVAIFGMRVLFPIVIVMLTAGLGWDTVVNLALHQPEQYAHHLERAHASISAFGGAFLLMLALTYFFDDAKKVHWIGWLETRLHRINQHWGVLLVVAALLAGYSLMPVNTHVEDTLVSGALGAAVFLVIHVLVNLLDRLQPGNHDGKLVGLAAFTSLIYLEILDASFSFDGVIGAFAITNDIVLIAAGLGIGALWVRSLTVFMVRRRMLGQFIYLEHGAHYTVLVLAVIMLASISWNISNYVPGLVGIGIIAASVIASVQERKAEKARRRSPDHF